MQARRLDQLALGAQAFAEEDELQLEEDDGVDARSAAFGDLCADPLPYKAKLQLRP
jgi:hypothetical protein